MKIPRKKISNALLKFEEGEIHNSKRFFINNTEVDYRGKKSNYHNKPICPKAAFNDLFDNYIRKKFREQTTIKKHTCLSLERNKSRNQKSPYLNNLLISVARLNRENIGNNENKIVKKPTRKRAGISVSLIRK